jgi:hypothetical protein
MNTSMRSMSMSTNINVYMEQLSKYGKRHETDKDMDMTYRWRGNLDMDMDMDMDMDLET